MGKDKRKRERKPEQVFQGLINNIDLEHCSRASER